MPFLDLQNAVGLAVNLLATALVAFAGYSVRTVVEKYRSQPLRRLWRPMYRDSKDKAIELVVGVFDDSTGRVGLFEFKAYGVLTSALRDIGLTLQPIPESGAHIGIGTRSLVVMGGLNVNSANDDIWTIISRDLVTVAVTPDQKIQISKGTGRGVYEAVRHSLSRVTDYGVIYRVNNSRVSVRGTGSTLGIFGLWGYGLYGAAIACIDGTLAQALHGAGLPADCEFVSVFVVEAHRDDITRISLLALDSFAL